MVVTVTQWFIATTTMLVVTTSTCVETLKATILDGNVTLS